jgi:general secretion pathway protein J
MSRAGHRGFTLIELLTALMILALLAVISYRGLDAVLDTRTRVVAETEKWQRVAAFCNRFERDVGLAAPRPVRSGAGIAPAWIGRPASVPGLRLELSRFASSVGVDPPRRVGYTRNDRDEIELWIWSGLDADPRDAPARHVLLTGVLALDLDYLDSARAWIPAWPAPNETAPIPRAVRLRILLDSGEEIVRVFALDP